MTGLKVGLTLAGIKSKTCRSIGFLLFLLRLCNFIIDVGFCRLQKYEILRHFHFLKFRIVVIINLQNKYIYNSYLSQSSDYQTHQFKCQRLSKYPSMTELDGFFASQTL